MNLVHAKGVSFWFRFMTVPAAMSYWWGWGSTLRLLLLLLFQPKRPADSDGGPAWRLWPHCTIPLLHPRGWIRVPRGTCCIFASPRHGRRALQLVLSVEGYRRIHQHVLFLSLVRYAARWLPPQVVPGRQWLVARSGHLHRRIVAESRQELGVCTGRLGGKKIGILGHTARLHTTPLYPKLDPGV
jgi:hypothetical protein